jgi:hypothetical protein
MDFEGMNVTIAYACLMLVLGVNSIERSAQEGVFVLGFFFSHSLCTVDMLLVLFNAAISNLVLLWNSPALNLVVSSLLHRSYFATTLLCLGTSRTRSRHVLA